MKLITLGLFLVFSTVSFGQTCREQVLKDYIKSTPEYNLHHLTGEVHKVPSGVAFFNYFGTKVKLGYKFDVELYIAGSEYHGGFGLDALVVDPKSCKTLKMVEVYAE